MKTILVLRHAKSDWNASYRDDFERPLAGRGRKDAPRIGEVLALLKIVPDLILSSPAVRARQTAELVAEGCGYGGKIRWEESFYVGGSPDLIAALRGLPGSVECPLLIGHNPTLETFVAALLSVVNGDEPVEGVVIRIPTGGLVCVDLNVTEWANVVPGSGVLRWFLTPNIVKALGKERQGD